MHGEYKEPGEKLVVVDLQEEDGVVTNAVLSGDFFAEPDDVIFRIQDALVGLKTDTTGEEVAKEVERQIRPGEVLFGLTPHGIGVAFRRAVGAAIDWDDIDFEVIWGPKVSPMVNIALDETLVEDVANGQRKPFMRIWEWDSPQIVIGSFQSYENEINQEGVEKHGITVSRRISGGGAMFMEPGNSITFSLVVPTALVDGMSFADSYKHLDQWVLDALKEVGVNAEYIPLNDISSDKGKIGGAAQKRFANGITLHHVTMAYDMDANKMMETLRIGQEKVRDKGLRSAVKRVDPMRSQTGMEREQIVEVLIDHFAKRYAASPGEITGEDLETAGEAVQEKFATEEWTHRVP